MTSSVLPVVLAAGRGTRMNSERPKVLHKCFGEPMIEHVLRSLRLAFDENPVLVVGDAQKSVRDTLDGTFREVRQDNPMGTGHALIRVLEDSNFEPGRNLLVTCGDIPGIAPETFESFREEYESSPSDLMLFTTEVEDPEGYGRVKLDEGNQSVAQVVEDSDASPSELSLKRIHTGVLMGTVNLFDTFLPVLDRDNEQGELYLTDVVKLLNEDDRTVDYFDFDDAWQVTGINTRRQLVEFEREGYRRIAYELLEGGVTVHDPESTKISPWAVVEPDVELEGSVSVIGKSRLGQGAKVIGDTRIEQHPFNLIAKVAHHNLAHVKVSPGR